MNINRFAFGSIFAAICTALTVTSSKPVFAQTQTTALHRPTAPTFSAEIAPIVYEKCSICHRPDQVGPFSLLTHEDFSRRSKTIRAVIDSGYMPPWKPVNHNVTFSNDRSLTAEQKQKMLVWIDAGCLQGDAAKTPAPPKFTAGWTLGTPDLVVKMNGQFQIPADGPDLYRSFVFPVDLPEDKWVKAVELRPQAKSAVHHAIFFLDSSGNARKKDGADGQAGIPGMGFLTNFGGASDADDSASSNGSGLLGRLRGGLARAESDIEDNSRIDNALARGLGGYVPGAMPNLLPGDLAMALPRGSDIVMQTHFHPSGKPETEQAELALYFADKPPSKQLVAIQVPAMFGFGANISIPPGEKNYRVTDSITIPVDTQVVGIGGHALYICREMKLTAETPDGQSTVLLKIDDWDLDWQDRYLFAEPVELAAGTVLHSEIVYDNSADNPENPYQPPQPIRWGRESNDEMGAITLMTVAKNEQQRPQLQSAVRKHFTETIVNRFSQGPLLSQMLMQLDQNGDGKLQESEAPPRLSGRVFGLLDQDKDGALDSAELERLKELRDRFGSGR